MRNPPLASFFLLLATGLLLPFSATSQAAGDGVAGAGVPDSIELHAHLFMKEGMTVFFRGPFDGPLRATKWNDRFSSMANPEALERSGIRILVATLYAHPLMVTDMRESIRRQIDLAEHFVATHPQWILVRNATEARAGLARGKRLMILSLEGASGILENERDVEEFANRRGIRIVNLLHLTDDRFGGVAFLRGFLALGTPLAWIRNLLHPRRADGVRVNDRGLTEEGQTMARMLIRHGVWLDLAHASDLAQEKLIPIMKEAGQPLLYTHTVLRRFFPAERAISDSQLELVRQTRGVMGLMPTEDMLDETPVDPRFCPAACAPEQCEGGVAALATHYAAAVGVLGAEAISMGSDYNGGVRHLKPFCSGTTGTQLDSGGLWNMGQIGELWRALVAVGAPVPRPLEKTVDYFLSAWEKVLR